MSNQGLLFDGRELEVVEVAIPSIGSKTVQALGLDPDQLHTGDEIEATIRYRVTHKSGGAAIDAEGFEKAEYGVTYVLAPVKTSFVVTAYLSRDEVEAAWQTAHTG